MRSIGMFTPATAAPRRGAAAPLPSQLLAPSVCLHPAARPRLPHPPASSASPPAAAAADRSPSEAAPQEEDLWQIPDRASWYLAKWAADDQPDWHPATFLSSSQVAPGVKEVVLGIEISRERVPLRNAYKHIGQRAAVRVNGGAEQVASPASPPFPVAALRDGLLRVRNDMTAGETKVASEEGSVTGELALLVGEKSAPELYKAGPTDLFEVGPFVGAGLDLRGPLAAIFMFPTVVIFVEGPEGLACARALAAATSDVGGLSFPLRADVRLYYRAPNQASFCYGDELAGWAAAYGVQVTTSTRDSFQDMFDDDDTLMYEPETTAALILTGPEGGEAEEAAAAVCREAEIAQVVRQSVEQPPTKYLKNGKEYLGE